MHVGLNLIFLVPGETGGMEVVARELIPALCHASGGARFTAFINQEATAAGGGPWGELIPSVTIPVRASNRFEWVRGEQQLLPRAAAQAGVDIVHSLASTGPVWGSFTRVVTIHDLIYRIHPEAHAGFRTIGMRVLVPLAARRSHRVIVPSVNTRKDVVNMLNVPADKVDVVPNGVGTTASAQPVAEPELRARYDLEDRPIVLSMSAKRPHKNLARLIEALGLIPPARRPALVMPGYPTWHERDLRAQVVSLGLEKSVRFLEWVPRSELEGLYGAAACFVFPSLYEGFGLPVLEAMQRGVPVACSNRSSLPEVAGDAALTFDPERPAEIAAAIERLLGDAPLASRLRSAGRERAASFTWEATARATVASYERALAGGRRPAGAR